MSQRPPKQQPEFGSDSFLDVIANMVGILVILIVLAGLKVSKIPVVVKTEAISSAQEAPVAEPVEVEPSPSIPATLPDNLSIAAVPVSEPPVIPQVPQIQIEEEPEEEQKTPEPQVIALNPSPALLEEARRVAILSQQLEAELLQFAEKIQNDELALQELRSLSQEISLDLDNKRKILRAKQDQLVSSHEELVAAKEKLARLRTRVVETEFSPPNVEKIEHKVTPISRTVQGAERHFRFEQGRICEVPIDDLVSQIKRQIESRKDWLIKTPKAQGEVGPLNGFLMRYTVQRENGGVLSELEMGPGVVSISVTQWLIQPTSELRTELPDDAMKPGSAFYRSLLTTPEGATLTFWVYPDSFEEFQRIKKFVSQQGFMVAARPLPKGVPIAGSPHGSRSSAQ